ncbi:MAG: sigma-70 family RNA polymerase sigma factor [Armatimonadetes bacterium]|nr:sigma-70 family RNA polymerase sigma factor [Armatimonadota bacterium]
MAVNPATEASDALLVQRAQAGDAESFRVLFERHHRRIYNAVYPIVRTAADAEDVTQDAFVRAYRALGSLREGQAFLSWLYRIALNLARNHVRDRRASLWESLDEQVVWGEETLERQIADPGPGPAQAAEEHEVQAVVRAAIEELSPAHREVVVLHHLQGVPVEEIARVVGCSVGTVKSRLARARDALKRKLRSYVLAEP